MLSASLKLKPNFHPERRSSKHAHPVVSHVVHSEFDPNSKKYYCCCCHTKTGTIILAILDALFSVAQAMQVIGLYWKASSVDPNMYLSNASVYHLTVVSIVMATVLCAIIGVYRDTVQLLIPYLLWRVAVIGITVGAVTIFIMALLKGPDRWLMDIIEAMSGRELDEDAIALANDRFDELTKGDSVGELRPGVAYPPGYEPPTKPPSPTTPPDVKSAANAILIFLAVCGCVAFVAAVWLLGVVGCCIRFIRDKVAADRLRKSQKGVSPSNSSVLSAVPKPSASNFSRSISDHTITSGTKPKTGRRAKPGGARTPVPLLIKNPAAAAIALEKQKSTESTSTSSAGIIEHASPGIQSRIPSRISFHQPTSKTVYYSKTNA